MTGRWMCHPASVASSPLAYSRAPLDAPGPPVLILHSWWGMTPSFPAYADRLAAAGFLAGCVDLYDGRLATTPAEARALRSAPRRQPMYRTMLAALDALRCDPACASSRAVLVGFSMGGHWAIWLAQRADVAADAVVLHYATRAVKEPGTGAVPVLAHFAERDPFVTASGRRTMERSLERAGWPYRAVDHPGTEHWFAEPDDEHFDERAADRAFAETLAFLSERER